MKKILFAALVAATALVACKKAETAPEVSISAAKSFTDGAAAGKVTLDKAAATDVSVSLALAADSQLKDDNVAIVPALVVIPAGQLEGAFKLTVGDPEPGDYTVKVEIAKAEGANIGAAKVASVKLTVEPENLMAVDMHNYMINASFLFGENSVATGANYTFEWKFKPYHWHHLGGKEVEEFDGQEHTTYCNRLGQVCNEDEKGILVRFGDGQADGSLRVNGSKYFVDGDGKDYFDHGKESWELDVWHVLSIVVDGTNLTVYKDGELFGQLDVKEDGQKGFNFERMALSMEWGYDAEGLDYPLGQDFHGYIEYIRFWQKALTQEEIKAGLCKVAKNAEGLASLWMFNTDSGAVIPDQVGGRNLDYNNNAYVWYKDSKTKYTRGAEAILEQWYEWDEAKDGPMCPAL